MLLAGFAGTAVAQPSVQLQVESKDIYAELPFTLSVIVKGFEQTPEPILTPVTVDNAEVTFLGMKPQVSSMVTIINGRRTDSNDVTFIYSYRITVPGPGRYAVGAIVASQGLMTASSPEAAFQAGSIEETEDMAIRLTMPVRPVWIGESFEATIDWYLRADVKSQNFFIPLFEHPDLFEFEAPETSGRAQMLEMETPTGTIALPYERDNATLDGKQFTRFRFKVEVTPLKAGALVVEPPRVTAALQVGGQGRDRFGFPTANTKLFKASGLNSQIEIKALPHNKRPGSFSNAVGTAFSIEVKAERTVLKVGDPLNLTLRVRGDGNLKGLILPKLDADGGLDPAAFTLPAQSPSGVVEELDGVLVKTFVVGVRLKSDNVTEIPPLAFSFFNPERGEYQTVRSEPIALSVSGSKVVGAQDVVSQKPFKDPTPSSSSASKPAKPESAAETSSSSVSLVGADMGLSAPDATLESAPTLTKVIPALAALYLLPLAFFGWRVVQRRTAGSRAQQSKVQSAQRALQEALAAAKREAARESVTALSSALRELLRSLERPLSDANPILEKLDVAAFDPRAAEAPLDAKLRTEIEAVAKSWGEQPASASGGGVAKASVVVLALASVLVAPHSASADELADARDLYQSAMETQDRDPRTHQFKRAEEAFRALAQAHPESPEVLVDWGNAALGAQELGVAVLAYRRALVLDPNNARAHKNLGWVRDALPSWLPKPKSEPSAVDAFFFWRDLFSKSMVAVMAALAFAVGALLLVPWGGPAGRRRALRLAAVAPFLLWLWMSASIFVSTNDVGNAAVVVTDGLVLKSADSPGATAVLVEPLPAGTEVHVVEARSSWVQVELADGQQGWLLASGVEALK
ncbi:MAG: hypothetical protein AUK47_14955 [Deltaproteobacteria bacterium CG2_30_63_29]|nr:MAG: hypothetical protein AUK47_14955 [Deltaproteobacteria bacterium CG2_30_63_29]